MSKTDRLLISELASQSRLEPTMRQIIVEGAVDVQLCRWVFRDLNLDPGTFLTVDSVEIPSELVAKHGRFDDCHGRCVTLGLEMIELGVDPGKSPIICFVDGEFDYITGNVGVCPLVVYLEVTSPEVLSLDDDVAEKFRANYLSGNSPSGTQIIEKITPILRFLMAARVVNHTRGWGLSWPSFNIKSADDGTLLFSETQFLTSYVRGSDVGLASAEAATRALLAQTTMVPTRQAVRGHDIAFIFGIAVRPFLKKELREMYKAELCERALMMGCDRATIAALPSFQKLRAHLVA